MKQKKYKALVSKHKAFVSKYVPCILKYMAYIFRENGNVDIQELSECDFGAFRMVCNVCVFPGFFDIPEIY